MSGVFGRNLVRRGLVAGMVFERVVFVRVVLVRAFLGSLPQRLRNIRMASTGSAPAGVSVM